MNRHKKILLAEDNQADVELIKLALAEMEMPIELIHFESGQGLLDYLQEQPIQDVNLILLDLNMPKVGGMKVLQTVYKNKRLNHLPIIIFTSSTQQNDIDACYELGANAYVPKPIDFNEYMKTIQSIVAFWLEINITADLSYNHFANGLN